MRFPTKHVLLATLLMSQSAYADAETSSFACSSQLMVSYDDGMVAQCEGDLTMNSGALMHETLISLTAVGLINITEYATLSTPNLSLYARDVLVDGALISRGGNVYIHSTNSLVLSDTASIDISSNTSQPTFSLSEYLAEPPRLTKPTIYPQQVVITGGQALDVDLVVASGSGIRLQSMTQAGQLVLTATPTGNPLQFSEAGLPNAHFLVSQVPEPSHLSMLLAGLMTLGLAVGANTKKR